MTTMTTERSRCIDALVEGALVTERDRGTLRALDATRAALDFASNDYLGLATDPRIRVRLIAALEAGCPLGSTGSRLLTGHSAYHVSVEAFLAEVFRVESALLFGSGYLANLGVMVALGSLDGATFFSDAANHASLIDGMRLASCPRVVFAHNAMDDLEAKLAASSARTKIIVTESIFSMDGDRAPIAQLLELAERFEAILVVDEAHATGVTGARGLGCLDGVDAPEVVAIHTGGKALGGQGAFVTSSHSLRALFVNRARAFIYTTGIAPLNALQLQYAIEAVLDDTRPRRRLADNVRILGGVSQIVPVVRGTEVVAVQQRLRAAGFEVRAIRYPTVSAGTERLRIALKAFHSPEEVRSLAALL